MLQRLTGKTIIVTGATMGIGEAVAHRLAADGASLILVARGRERGEALLAELGDRARFLAADVTDPTTADAAVEAAKEFGGVDVLVNNAGIDFTGDLLETREEDVRRVFETNALGAIWMLVHVARELKARGGGSIINVTSRLASIGVPTMAIYSASKGALLSLTRGAAVELAPFGVRVNAVAPGLTATPLMREWIDAQPDPEQFRARTAATIPQGRFGEPEDVAAAVAFLAADESKHITGASIPVDGGYTAA
ncbi:MAG TPA: SDR family oxidoreductase [Solirubrobacteraceae bacterium]|nr:SDR family oxidoreductase [Solirubrobacteraceae bacterium]